jgi:hypothetical protein
LRHPYIAFIEIGGHHTCEIHEPIVWVGLICLSGGDVAGVSVEQSVLSCPERDACHGRVSGYHDS